MFMNLSHSSCPKMTQQIENTLIPFRNSKFSFSASPIVTIFFRLSYRLNAFRTLIPLVSLVDTNDTIEAAIPSVKSPNSNPSTA